MSISYPVQMPDNGRGFIKKTSFRLKHAQAQSVSPYSYRSQVVDFLGDVLEVDVTLAPMLRADGARWAAFLASLRGMTGTFLLANRDQPSPIGAGGPALAWGSQPAGARQISTRRWQKGNTKVLEAGDWFSLNNHLYMAAEPAITDSLGRATFEISPMVRSTIPSNRPLGTKFPSGIFRMANPEQVWTTDDFVHTEATFVAVEAI